MPSGSALALCPGFPGVRFASRAAYETFRASSQPMLDARAAYEAALADAARTAPRPGTCAPCLRPACFTPAKPAYWQESLTCDCAARLNTAQRALLHFTQEAGLRPWAHLLFIGGAAEREAPLAARFAALSAPPPADGSFHFAVAPDASALLSDPQGALAALHARLLPGGRLLFGLPPAPDKAPPLGQIAWEVLDTLRHAGFSDPAAYLYWSEELGYPGSMNILFKATR